MFPFLFINYGVLCWMCDYKYGMVEISSLLFNVDVSEGARVYVLCVDSRLLEVCGHGLLRVGTHTPLSLSLVKTYFLQRVGLGWVGLSRFSGKLPRHVFARFYSS